MPMLLSLQEKIYMCVGSIAVIVRWKRQLLSRMSPAGFFRKDLEMEQAAALLLSPGCSLCLWSGDSEIFSCKYLPLVV